MPQSIRVYTEEVLDPGEVPRPIPHRVVFIQPNLTAWRDVMDGDPPLPGEVHHRFVRGADAWTLVTYLVLKARGQPVELSEKMVPGAICVAHFDYIQRRAMPYQSYIVAVRADRGPVYVCERQIVQSPILVKSPRDHYLPYWPQPGLLARDPARGARLERVGFLGRERNLAESFRDERFRQRLAEMGMELVIRTERGQWHDYHDLDAVLAIRHGNPRWLATKPASKLINSWLAGCPALLGDEPAFRALRRSELDYEIVSTPDEAIEALRRLRSPERYRQMVENARERGAAYGLAPVARCWEELLAGPVAEDFERWQGRVPAVQGPLRLARFLARTALQRLLPNRYKR
jgi:hypothetical protein